MATPSIFPSLSRNFSLDSSQTTEDDTVRDAMENGYVATRPRFTRARRTWKANVRNLLLEDARALQSFRDSIVKRGALPFYLPNLIKNGSFELPAVPGSGELAEMWQARPDAGGTVAITSAAFDGSAAVQFASVANQDVTAQNANIGGVLSGSNIHANPGDTLGVGYWYQVQATSQGLYFEVRLRAVFDDGKTQSVAVANILPPGVTSGWKQALSYITVPTSPTASLRLLQLQLSPCIIGAATKSTLAPNEIVVLLDFVGVAVTATATPVAMMLGSSSVASRVRFSKVPEIADLGFIGGAKRFGCTFEVTEL